MEDPNRKKRLLLLLVLVVTIFALGVMIWFFFFNSKKTGDITQPTGGLSIGKDLPARFGFIFGEEKPSSQTETEVTLAKEEALVQVWDKPTAGSLFITQIILQDIFATTTSKVKPVAQASSTPTPPVEILVKKTIRATTSILMFVDRTTGYVYGYDKKSTKPYQISNTTIPGVYDAYIFNGGKSVLMRYLDGDRKTIITTLANIPQVREGETPLPLINSVFLPKNVTSVAESDSSQKISYVIPNSTGSSIYTLTPEGQALVASSPFSEWTLRYGGEQLYAQNKPSAYIEGSLATLPFFERAVSNKTGLVSLPSPEGRTLNSMWSNSGLVTYLLHKGDVINSSIRTIATKCSWLKLTPVVLCAVPNEIPTTVEGLPDDWYQGRYMFNDTLQFIDAVTGTPYPLYSFDSKLGEMDLIKLTLSANEHDISFIRKQDETLWLLKTDLLTPSGE